MTADDYILTHRKREDTAMDKIATGDMEYIEALHKALCVQFSEHDFEIVGDERLSTLGITYIGVGQWLSVGRFCAGFRAGWTSQRKENE